MADTFRVDIEGDERVIRVTRKIAAAISNPQPMFKLLSVYMMDIFRRAIQQRADPATGFTKGWGPLKPSTLDSTYLGRPRRSYGFVPLHRTMHMFNSVGPLSLSANKVSIGTRVPHAAYHNSQPVSSRRKFPQRRFLGWEPDAPKNIAAIISEHLRKEAGV